MTVSLVVVAFEMTGGLEYLVPCAVAIMAAKAFGAWLGVGSIYEEQFAAMRYPFLPPGASVEGPTTVGQMGLLSREMCVVRAGGVTVGELRGVVQRCDYRGYPVVLATGQLLGYITRRDLWRELQNAGKGAEGDVSSHVVNFKEGEEGLTHSSEAGVLNLAQFMDYSPLVLHYQNSVSRLLQLFVSLGVHHVLITKNGALLGIVTKNDLVEFMHKPESDGTPPSGNGGEEETSHPLLISDVGTAEIEDMERESSPEPL